MPKLHTPPEREVSSVSAGQIESTQHTAFSKRLFIGLGFALAGIVFARPGNLWGEYQLMGQTGSGTLVVVGLLIRLWAASCAGNHTHNAEISAPALVTTGPYAYVRNPIYFGSMVLGIGMVGLIGDPWLLLPCVGAFSTLYVVIVPAEERFLRQRFGEQYVSYCVAVPRFVPRLTPWKTMEVRPFRWSVVRGELIIWLVIASIYGAILGLQALRIAQPGTKL